jgi:hypothetical protein
MVRLYPEKRRLPMQPVIDDGMNANYALGLCIRL